MDAPRLHNTILRTFLWVVLASLGLLTLYLLDVERDVIERETRARLESTARLLAQDFPSIAELDPAVAQARIRAAGEASGLRLTVIRPDGRVLADSEAEPGRMDNHAARPEVVAALRGQQGHSRRHSVSVGRDLLYVAVPVREGGQVAAVVRVAMPLRTFQESMASMNRRVIVAAAVLSLLAGVVGYGLARRISRPVEQMTVVARAYAGGELNQRVWPARTRELADLAHAMNSMAQQLGEKIRTVEGLLEQERVVFQSMIEGLLVIDQDQRVLDMNQAAAGMLNVDAERTRGRQMLEVVRNRELVRLVERALGDTGTVEGVVVVHGQAQRHLQVHGTSLRRPGENPRGVLMVLTDVTRLRQLETMRRDFVANASHELKTPVTSIKGFAETLESGDLGPEETRRFVGIITRQAEQLATLIDDLLALTRIEHEQEAGDVVLAVQPLVPVLEAAMDTCRPEANEKGIRLTLEAAVDLEASMDAALMERALTNLVDNAVKYSDRGEVRVSARVNGDDVTVTVSDEGCGIPREHLARIFERFYRVDKARSRKLGGTGLGLSIVKHIVQAHRGDVAVTSEVNKGSTFTIRWPRAMASRGAQQRDAAGSV
jgi:two-component system phosphate regulon sensor histidine kinase PhoR